MELAGDRPVSRPARPCWLGPALAGLAPVVAIAVAALVGRGLADDTFLYAEYGRKMAHGLVPYRDFFFDWPPGAILPLLTPTLGGASYAGWFHLLDAVYAAVAVVLTAVTLTGIGVRGRRVYQAAVISALFPWALGAIALNSFDYWPALFTIAALAATVHGRDRLGAGLLGVGIVAKVYPVVLLPVLLLWILRRRGRAAAVRACATCAAVVAVATAPFVALGFHGFVQTTAEQLHRGLQIESLGASGLMALDHLGVLHVHFVLGKPYSVDLVGDGVALTALLSTLLTLVALAAVYLSYAAGPDDPQRLATASAAAVGAWVAFGHVLSPQYLVWLFALVPLVAGSEGVIASGLLVVACGLTTVWFPNEFAQLADVGGVSWYALGRNVTLVVMLAAMLRSLLRSAAVTVPRGLRSRAPAAVLRLLAAR